MASYEPPMDLPPRRAPQGMRSRNNSAASAKYTPEAYQASARFNPPPQAASGYPYPNGMPTSRVSPNEPMSTYAGYQPDGPLNYADNNLHPASAANPPYPTSAADPYMQPANYGAERRQSHSSRHSRGSPEAQRPRRSHESHRSHKSHRSHRTSSEERDREDRHRRRVMQRRRSDYDKPVERRDTRRPTFGDTIFSLYDTLKSSLGPRDKY